MVVWSIWGTTFQCVLHVFWLFTIGSVHLFSCIKGHNGISINCQIDRIWGQIRWVGGLMSKTWTEGVSFWHYRLCLFLQSSNWPGSCLEAILQTCEGWQFSWTTCAVNAAWASLLISDGVLRGDYYIILLPWADEREHQRIWSVSLGKY